MRRISILFLLLATVMVAATVEFADEDLRTKVAERFEVPAGFTASGVISVKAAGLGAIVSFRDSFPDFGDPTREIISIKMPGGVTLKGDSALKMADEMEIKELTDFSLITQKIRSADWDKATTKVNKTLAKQGNDKYIKASLDLPPESGFEFDGYVFLSPDGSNPVKLIQVREKSGGDNTVMNWYMKDHGGFDFPEKIEIYLENTVIGKKILIDIEIMYLGK